VTSVLLQLKPFASGDSCPFRTVLVLYQKCGIHELLVYSTHLTGRLRIVIHANLNDAIVPLGN
jgi:hypothetical protein